MFYLTETKFQCWRAAALSDGGEKLLYLGRSTTQVRAGYALAYADLLGDEERSSVSQIALQCWVGAADQGRWVTKDVLPVPTSIHPGSTRLSKSLHAEEIAS